METLRQSPRKSDLTPLITQRGRVVRVSLILPVEVNRIPQWLQTILTPHRERFAEEWCPDYWAALLRLSGFQWHDQWGSAAAQEWFVSEPIPPEKQAAVLVVAKRLNIDMAMAADFRHVLVPKGTWRR